MSNEAKEMEGVRATIEFGLDVKQFMGTNLGRYLQHKANADMEAALDALATVDPEDPKAIRKLQNDAVVAARILSWIAEAVNEGEQAERQYVEMNA